MIVGIGPNALRDRRRLRRAQQPSGLPGAGVPRPGAPRRRRRRARALVRSAGAAIPVLPLDARAKELPGWLGQPHVVVALELDEMLGREGLIESLSFYHGDIDVISPLKGLPINNTRVSHFFSRDILSLAHPQQSGAALAAAGQARVRPGGGLRCCSCSWRPCWRWWRCKIRLADGGGVIFAHTRVGRHGQLFPCYKFRTMVANSAEVLAELLAARPGGPGRVGPGPQAAPRPPDHRRSAGSCARPAWTSCRSCSTWCAAR